MPVWRTGPGDLRLWTSGCVPAGLMMLGGKSRKPQKQG